MQRQSAHTQDHLIVVFAVQFSSGDQPPTPDPSFCTTFPSEGAAGGFTFIVCPVCFGSVPSDLSLQYNDDSNGLSQAECVDTSGAT